MLTDFIETLNATVSRCPEKTAVVAGNETVTFGEIKDRINKIAAILQADGITAGKIVPILLPHGPDAYAAMFAVWKIGAVVCILDMNYPSERIQTIRQECETDYVMDANRLEQAYQQSVIADIPAVSVSPDSLAMLVFTSGSTGKPKGVMLPRHVIDRVVQNISNESLNQDDIYLNIAPISFVASLGMAVAPIALGTTTHIATDALRKDLKLLIGYIQKHKITGCFIPPAIAPIFLKYADGLLRTMFVGSERVRNTFSTKTKCYCVYGASETGSLLTMFTIDKPYDNTPIGFPVEGSKIYLLGEDNQPVPQGEIGEICVSGQIALGYWRSPELNSERFIENPFVKGETLFRTNDLGRFLPDGALEFVNRKDWMLKVHGNRVEPGEIEAVMLENAKLSKAVVIGFTDASGETRLYGCYTATEVVDPAVLRKSLESKLPDYMVPAFLEQLDSLPINFNGKIDRTKIIPPDIAVHQTDYAAPTNEKERVLCDAFAEVLGLTQVGINDDFVHLGGDSISVVKVQLLLPKDMQVSGAAITSLRTPKRIAEEGIILPSIPIAADRREWTVTFDEVTTLNRYLREPQAIGHNVNIPINLSGKLDIARLEKSIRHLLTENRVLRSVYRQDASEGFIRIIKDIPSVVLEHISCTRDTVMQAFAERNTPFDITTGPLYRFFLFETNTEEYTLLCSVFHSVIDGPGLQLLIDQLADLYSGRKEFTASETPDFLDYAQWVHTDTR